MEYPYAEVEVRSDGSLHDPAQLAAAVAMVRDSGATDVLVMVHGWNNDMVAARRLYEQLAASMGAVESSVPAFRGRRLAVIGILWPSVRWAEEGTIAGGGAGALDPVGALAADIPALVGDPVVGERLAQLVPLLETTPEAREEYLALLRELLPAPGGADDEDPPPTALTQGSTDEVFEAARGSGGLLGAPAEGGAAGLGLSGFLRAARNLLNLTTYYTMKDRAGKVGAGGIARVLQEVHDAAPSARLHMVGHSFGARAATAAAAATSAPVHSVSLLQAAFSHFALAADYDGQGSDGAFRGVPSRLAGPMVVTHTRNDRAVGLAYAIASRVARQSAAWLGDADDPYGGMGSNGALRTPEAGPAGRLLDVGGHYVLRPGQVTNLLADDFIRDHGDVSNRQVAHAVLSALVS